MSTRTFLRFVLLCATSAAPLLNASTIAGFCRQSGSLNVLPFTLDTTTGTMLAFPAYTVGADHAGHYSASNTNGTGSGSSPSILVTGIQPSGSGTTPEQLVTVDVTSGTIVRSAAGFSNASFTGNSMTIRPGVTPPTLIVAQPASPAPVNNPSTNLYRIDVTSGTVTTVDNLPFTATRTWRGSVAHVFFDSAQPTFAWVLQPCTLDWPQQLEKVNANTAAFTVSSFTDEFCLDAPGWFAGNRFFALEIRPEGPQLVRLTTVGAITPLGSPVSGWRRAPMSPYIGSRPSSTLYALNDVQTSLSIWNVVTGAQSTLPITFQSPCARGSIMSFASVY